MPTQATNARRLLLGLICAATLSACAPTASFTLVPTDSVRVGPPRDLSALTELDRTAWRIWLAMESGRLQLDRYDTTALIDLDLPSGARWTLEEFDVVSFRLRLEGASGEVRVITESGVSANP